MTTDEQRPLLDDPVIRRLQQAFAHEEPTTELAEVLRRAADYLVVDQRAAAPQPAARHRLTSDDLTAARQREPAAVTRLYSAYAPALYRFFMAEVGNRQQAQDLTGSVFVSVIEALPGFRGPVEALGGWLFRIARHDLDDFRRKHARSPMAAASMSDIQPLLQALQAIVDHPDAVPPAALPQLVRRLLSTSDRTTDAPLHRLSPRERQVLALLGRGRSNAQISRELYISPHAVRTRIENILLKLEMHTNLEAATFAMQHDWSPGLEDPEELSIEHLAGSRMIAAIQQLPPDEREVLLLRMAAGLTAPEVAAALHKTTGAVKALQHRGLARLAGVLGLRGPDLDDAAAKLRAWLRRPPPPPSADPTPGHQEGMRPGPTERADPRKQ
jgi:RNA polymerase sigma factor (sigma-70 family)